MGIKKPRFYSFKLIAKIKGLEEAGQENKDLLSEAINSFDKLFDILKPWEAVHLPWEAVPER
jgi:flagellar biosynthesis/type III secretory pathway chaperone